MKDLLSLLRKKIIGDIKLEKKHYFIIIVVALWLLLAIIGGGRFYQKYYGVENAALIRLPHGRLLSKVTALSIAMVCIVFFGRTILRAVSNCQKEREILIFSIPVFLLLLATLLTNLSYSDLVTGYYGGDEKFIWDMAVNLNPFAFGYTGGVFMISFFIFPITIGPSLVKLFYCSLIFGYTLYRMKERTDSNAIFLLYCLFLLRPFREFGVQVHRMQWYGWLYLFLAVKLFFDSSEKRTRIKTDILLVSLCLSVLAFWRKEAFYLLVLGPILIYVCYLRKGGLEGGKSSKRSVVSSFGCFIACALIVGIPQMIFSLSLPASDQVEWEAFFVHLMAEPSFQREECAQELDNIQEYMDIERVDEYNNDLKWEAFEDCWWRSTSFYGGKYYAIKSGNPTEYQSFRTNVIEMIKKQPIPFVQSRIKAFAYAARAKNVMDGVKNEEYNLYLPLIITFLLFGYAVKKKDICLFLLMFGIVIHIMLTAATMPASYAKYFYEMYIIAYVFGSYLLIDLLKRTHVPNGSYSI